MKGICLKGRKSNVGALFPDFKKNPVIVRNAVGFLCILVMTFQKSIHKSVISQDALPEISAEKPVTMRRPICLDSSSSTHTHTNTFIICGAPIQKRRECPHQRWKGFLLQVFLHNHPQLEIQLFMIKHKLLSFLYPLWKTDSVFSSSCLKILF